MTTMALAQGLQAKGNCGQRVLENECENDIQGDQMTKKSACTDDTDEMLMGEHSIGANDSPITSDRSQSLRSLNSSDSLGGGVGTEAESVDDTFDGMCNIDEDLQQNQLGEDSSIDTNDDDEWDLGAMMAAPLTPIEKRKTRKKRVSELKDKKNRKDQIYGSIDTATDGISPTIETKDGVGRKIPFAGAIPTESYSTANSTYATASLAADSSKGSIDFYSVAAESKRSIDTSNSMAAESKKSIDAISMSKRSIDTSGESKRSIDTASASKISIDSGNENTKKAVESSNKKGKKKRKGKRRESKRKGSSDIDDSNSTWWDLSPVPTTPSKGRGRKVTPKKTTLAISPLMDTEDREDIKNIISSPTPRTPSSRTPKKRHSRKTPTSRTPSSRTPKKRHGRKTTPSMVSRVSLPESLPFSFPDSLPFTNDENDDDIKNLITASSVKRQDRVIREEYVTTPAAPPPSGSSPSKSLENQNNTETQKNSGYGGKIGLNDMIREAAKERQERIVETKRDANTIVAAIESNKIVIVEDVHSENEEDQVLKVQEEEDDQATGMDFDCCKPFDFLSPKLPFQSPVTVKRSISSQLRKHKLKVVPNAAYEKQRQRDKEHHRKKFVSVAGEAATYGRLVRLEEIVVESGGTKEQQNDRNTWSGPKLLMDDRRSNALRAIQEAAAMGRLKRLKPETVTNYDVTALFDLNDDHFDIENQVDEHGQQICRTNFLVDKHVKETAEAKKERMWSDSDAIGDRDDIIATYKDFDDVKLPSDILPTYDQILGRRLNSKKNDFSNSADLAMIRVQMLEAKDEDPDSPKMTRNRLRVLELISSAVAASAGERDARLQQPRAQLKVTRKCYCPYCKRPTAYQTHKYRRLMYPDRFNDDKVCEPVDAAADTTVTKENAWAITPGGRKKKVIKIVRRRKKRPNKGEQSVTVMTSSDKMKNGIGSSLSPEELESLTEQLQKQGAKGMTTDELVLIASALRERSSTPANDSPILKADEAPNSKEQVHPSPKEQEEAGVDLSSEKLLQSFPDLSSTADEEKETQSQKTKLAITSQPSMEQKSTDMTTKQLDLLTKSQPSNGKISTDSTERNDDYPLSLPAPPSQARLTPNKKVQRVNRDPFSDLPGPPSGEFSMETTVETLTELQKGDSSKCISPSAYSRQVKEACRKEETPRKKTLRSRLKDLARSASPRRRKGPLSTCSESNDRKRSTSARRARRHSQSPRPNHEGLQNSWHGSKGEENSTPKSARRRGRRSLTSLVIPQRVETPSPHSQTKTIKAPPLAGSMSIPEQKSQMIDDEKAQKKKESWEPLRRSPKRTSSLPIGQKKGMPQDIIRKSKDPRGHRWDSEKIRNPRRINSLGNRQPPSRTKSFDDEQLSPRRISSLGNRQPPSRTKSFDEQLRCTSNDPPARRLKPNTEEEQQSKTPIGTTPKDLVQNRNVSSRQITSTPKTIPRKSKSVDKSVESSAREYLGSPTAQKRGVSSRGRKKEHYSSTPTSQVKRNLTLIDSSTPKPIPLFISITPDRSVDSNSHSTEVTSAETPDSSFSSDPTVQHYKRSRSLNRLGHEKNPNQLRRNLKRGKRAESTRHLSKERYQETCKVSSNSAPLKKEKPKKRAHSLDRAAAFMKAKTKGNATDSTQDKSKKNSRTRNWLKRGQKDKS